MNCVKKQIKLPLLLAYHEQFRYSVLDTDIQRHKLEGEINLLIW